MSDAEERALQDPPVLEATGRRAVEDGAWIRARNGRRGEQLEISITRYLSLPGTDDALECQGGFVDHVTRRQMREAMQIIETVCASLELPQG